MTSLSVPIDGAPPRPSSARRVGGAIVDAFGVTLLAGKVLVQHWPVLLALALAGQIVREGLVILTADIANDHGPIAYLVFALVPVSILVSMVLMLRRARSSLPGLATTAARRGPVVADVATVLLPFLVYYSFAGLLTADDQDVTAWQKTLIFAAIWDGLGGFRLAPQSIVGLAAVAIVGLVGGLRWLLKRSSFAARHPIVGLPAAYLEVLWIILGTSMLLSVLEGALRWAQGRRAWVAVVNWLHGDFANAGPLACVARGVVGGWLQVWPVIGATLLIPTAAVAAGAVVYGIQHDAVPVPAKDRSGGRRLPRFARAIGAVVRRGVAWRVGPAISGLRLLPRAGLPSVLVYCLACVAVSTAPGWLRVLERVVVGPQDRQEVWIPLHRVLGLFNQAFALMLLMALVAGALGWVAKRGGLGAASAGQQPGVPRQLGGHEEPDGDGSGIGRDQKVHVAAQD